MRERTDNIIRRYGGEMKPDPQKKRLAMEEIERAIERKRPRYTPTVAELFRIQLEYISPVFWGIQGTLLAAIVLLLFWTDAEYGGVRSYLWWGSLAAAWMGPVVSGGLGRHFSGGMAELEQSCYLNLSQMWAMRMLLSGGIDLLLLGICCGGIVWNTDTPPEQVSVYLLTPFVLSNLCCLAVMTLVRGGRGRYWQAALAVLTSLLALLPSFEPLAYDAEYLWVWILLLAFGTGLWAGQLRQCYKKITGGEILCWS